MDKIINKYFFLTFSCLLFVQFLAGLWYINQPFVDGRIHYNWGPSFWLLQAEKINAVDAGLSSTYWGTKDYPAHPQLIGPVVSIWTRIFGYSEGSIRTLPLLLTVLATLFLTLAIRLFTDNKKALVFLLIFASLPLIYIYGKKLDQEALVLLFLGIHLFGIGLINQSKSKGYYIAGIGSLGMALSDWSGIVFAGIISLSSLLIWKWHEDKKKILTFIGVSWGTTILGLAIFIAQSYLQTKPSSVSDFINSYYELWKFRAGMTGHFSWSAWFSQQMTFLSENYTITLFLLGITGLAVSCKSKLLSIEKNTKKILILIFAITIGHLFYLVFLREASLVHIYYQYFLSIPLAFGLLMLIEFITKKVRPETRNILWGWLLTITLVFTISTSAYTYHNLLFKDSGGDSSDIELMKSIKNIPEDKKVVVAEVNNVAMFWYQNPNMEYYSGRTLKTYLLEDGVPFADYQVVPSSQVKGYVAVINEGAYGSQVFVASSTCSTNMCIIKLEKRR